ncbi:MAG: TetR/AcrR family transcriptional regulator [Burkholderiales bacterium]|nr:TetR/AcrR family transcriptional regulator [Burkholderiales bacterium]MDE2398899.1 TetR/AcrR family transcriptional regulator [Burkholderiales bacterium]MDE2456198.1 TetR/AcrR family transcriptional regulator [Burkholderiales bacterium]
MKTRSTPAGRKTVRHRTQAERSQTTQRKIVESALRLLQKVGFAQTNLQDIARGAKVTLGALQHQFGSRQVLMERVVDEVMAPLADVGTAWPEDAANLALDRRAHEFVRLAWESVYAPPSYVAAWSLFFGCKTTPALFKRIDEHQARIDPLFFAHFAAVFPEVARRYPQPEQFAAVIFAALRGLAVMRLFKVDEQANKLQLEVVAQMIIQAGSA